jgi:signal transduction histidine kinase
MNLLCADDQCQHTDDDFDLLANLGGQISEIVANAWFRMKLNEKEAARQMLLESLVKAQEEERSRLGRELHDGAGQTLTGLLMHLKALERRAQATELHDDLAESLDLVSGTIKELRQISHHLRPAALDELGLETAILTLLRDMCQESPLQWETEINLDERPVPNEIEIGLYRIAQECLTNVLRHAQATSLRLELVRDPQAIRMAIEDNGSGFEPEAVASNGQRGIGLLSMQERTELLGGTFDVFSGVGEGTLVQVRVPMSEA